MSEIRKGAILNYLLLFLQIGIPLILTPIIMGKLGAAEYGVYMLAGTIMARLYLSDLGRTTTTKFLSEYQSKNDAAGEAAFLGNITLLYAAIGAIILLLGLILYPWLGDIFPRFSEQELGIYRILYILMLVNAAIMFPARSLVGVADSRQKFAVPSFIAVCFTIVNALATLFILHYGGRSVALMSFTISAGILALLINIAYCFKGLGARIRWNQWSRTLCHSIIIFSFWMFLNQLINMLNAGTGNYIVAITQGSVPAGIYTNGLQIYAHYFMLAGVLTALFLPRVVHMVAQGATPSAQTNAMIRLGRVQLMILGFFLFILLFFGREFFQLWVGHIPNANPELSWFITAALIIPQTFSLVQALGWQISQARDALKQRVLITGFNSILFIVVSFFVCKHWGMHAQAIWAAASILIQLLMINLIHYRGLGLEIGRFYREVFRKTPLIAPGLAACCWGINSIISAGSWGCLLAKILLFAALYLPAVYMTYVSKEEKSLLWPHKN